MRSIHRSSLLLTI